MQNFQCITVKVKVLTNKEPAYVGDGKKKKKQDVLITDHTGLAKLTLWEKAVDSLAEAESYTLKNFVVKEYKSKPKDGAEISAIADIGDVQESDSDSDHTL